MKKILLIANNARSMLLFRSCFIKKLLSLGFEVIVCAPYDELSFVSLEKLGAKTNLLQIDRKGINPFREILSFLQIRKILFQHRPYACIFYTIKPVIYGSLACLGSGINNIYSVITGLGYVFIGNSFLQKVLRFFVKISYAQALKNNEKVFFLNRDDLSYFVANKMVADIQSCLLNGEGVDLEYYAFNNQPNDTIVFLFVGRLLRDKGLYEYVAAARGLKSQYKQVIFRVVGALDNNPSCIEKRELQQWINDGVIDYCGYLTDIKNVLERSTIFVLPSYREGMPISILEAMAIGRPIITTNAPGCRETVGEGINGFLVPIKDVDALRGAMERFILHPELINSMGKESRRLAEEKYDVNKVNKVILENMGVL